jgi:hypothetical protein
MRTRVLPLALCGLLLVAGATRADGDAAKVADYVKALRSKNAAVRKQVALALGDLGEKAKSAVPALREALLDADEGVQVAAAAALEKVNGDAKAPADVATELRRLREQVEAVRQKAEAEAARADKAEKEKTLLREKLATAQVEAQLLQNRSRQLEQRIVELEKEHGRKPKEVAPADRANAAPADVEGLVKAVDDKSGLVTITVGSDAGVRKGHRLEVYRLKPSAKYLGQVEIVDVTATQAVGKPVGKAKETIQVGDSVSSRLTKK